MKRRGGQFLLIVATLVVSLSATTSGSAQDATEYPVTINQGTCDASGEVAFELIELGAATSADGSPVPALESVGSGAGTPVLRSVTTLDASLSDLVTEPHSLVVSEPGERINRVIACGEIAGIMTSQMAGMVMPGDELAIGLKEQGDSGYAGIALITAEGAAASVRIYLASGLVEGSPAGDD